MNRVDGSTRLHKYPTKVIIPFRLEKIITLISYKSNTFLLAREKTLYAAVHGRI